MEAIGGYFELADREEGSAFPHQNGILLNTGRNALEYILKCLPDVKKVFLPLFTCEVILEPLKRNYITYNFYSINNKFEIADEIRLGEGDYLIANNYFGLKDAYIAELSKMYGERLIVDNAQALFAPVREGIKAFYSTRKFVGVADGGIAVGVDGKYSFLFDEDDSTRHNSHLLIRKERGAEAGFKQFQENESKLDNQPILRMCKNTQDILLHIDYERVVEQRKANFKFLHEALGQTNHLQIPSLGSFSCPMVYPYWGQFDNDIRSELIKKKVFVARYWPNVLNWDPHESLEHLYAEKIVPLPIDQRYNDNEMERIVKIINHKI